MVAGDLGGLQVGHVVLVDADAHLHGQRDIALGGLGRGCFNDRGVEVGLPGQRRAAALACDLGDRAAEVQIDVVRQVLVNHHAHGGTHGCRIHAVDLDGADLFVGVVRNDAQGFGVAFHQRAGGDHFGHVQPAAVFTAEAAEGAVGHASHRSKDHRSINGQLAKLQRWQLEGRRVGWRISQGRHPSIVSHERKSGTEILIKLCSADAGLFPRCQPKWCNDK